MKMFKNALITFLGLAALALLAPAPARGQEKVFVTNTADEPALVRDVDAAALTHVGRRASDIVNLSGFPLASGEIIFLRSLRNGNATSFTIPAGKVFVVTDVNWQVSAGNPGDVARLSLSVQNLANPSLARLVYNSVVTLNGGGVAGANESLGSGFVVSSAAKVTAALTVPTGGLNGLLLRGYFAPDE